MSLVVPNEGAPALLTQALGKTAFPASNWLIKLYQNNYTPVPGSSASNFTEATFTGYTSQSIVPANWTTPTIISNRASSTANSGSPYTWTNTGSAQTIYGYFVVDQVSGYVIFAELFATSRTLNTSDALELTLNFTGGTQT